MPCYDPPPDYFRGMNDGKEDGRARIAELTGKLARAEAHPLWHMSGAGEKRMPGTMA